MTTVERFKERGDYHQTAAYARVMERIGWDVVMVDGQFLFSRRVGVLAFAKLQRPAFVSVAHLKEIKRRLRIVQLLVEPGIGMGDIPKGALPSNRHQSYTKTLIVDLRGTPDDWKKNFSPMIRRHLKSKCEITTIPFEEVTQDLMAEVFALHKRWGEEKKVLGYDDAFLRAIVEEFHTQGWLLITRKEGRLIGAFFLLVHHGVGLYFYQFTSPEGRALHIPAQFAFEAMKQSSSVGCDLFDFCSCYDERYPSENPRWQGFTKHKLLFHPLPVSYPPSFLIP